MGNLPEDMDYGFAAEEMNSIGVLLAREALRGENIEDNAVYRIKFENGIGEFTTYIRGKTVKRETKPLHMLIRQRLEQEFTNDITGIEREMLEYDSGICAKYMGCNLKDREYQGVIRCANRIIKNCELIEEYIEKKSRVNELMKKNAEIARDMTFNGWENPRTANIRIALNKAVEEKDSLRITELEKQLEEYEPPKIGY